ncbi:hypothetical protein [Kribbella sp.]|nr:hypothetical protein [Kribbella sp.]HZX08376.1 hypothetical protein [Kribbella sp.]
MADREGVSQPENQQAESAVTQALWVRRSAVEDLPETAGLWVERG